MGSVGIGEWGIIGYGSTRGVSLYRTAPAKERQYGKRHGHDDSSAIEKDEQMMGEQQIIYSESEWGENSQ